MEIAVILKLLDLAALGFSAWERYDERKRQGSAAMADIDSLRRRILAGDVTHEEASAEVDRIIMPIISARKSAIGKLPVYQVGEFDD